MYDYRRLNFHSSLPNRFIRTLDIHNHSSLSVTANDPTRARDGSIVAVDE
jgi:hypothetical protein